MSGVPHEDHDSKLAKLVSAFPTIDKAKIERTLLLNGGDIYQTAKILESDQSTASGKYNLQHADEMHHFGDRYGPTYDQRQTNKYDSPVSAKYHVPNANSSIIGDNNRGTQIGHMSGITNSVNRVSGKGNIGIAQHYGSGDFVNTKTVHDPQRKS